MGLGHHTIIIVPHTRARFRKVRLTSRQLALAAVALLLLTFGSVLVTWTLLTRTVDRDELARVRGENEAIRQVNESFESAVRDLESRLAEYEERTRKLAIVAGLDSLEGPTGAGIGGAVVDEGGDEAGELLAELEARATTLDGALSQVASGLGLRIERISSTPAIPPARGVLTSGFGVRRDPLTGSRAPHPGVDIAAYPGSAVVAPADGLVVRSGRVGGLGRAVYLSHGFGLATRFGHMSRLAVDQGQEVERGDVIGYVGSSGRSTGYHLHYEVRVDGKPVNPLGFMLDPLPDRF